MNFSFGIGEEEMERIEWKNLPRVKIFRRKFFSCPQLATKSSDLVPAPLFDSSRKAVTQLYSSLLKNY